MFDALTLKPATFGLDISDLSLKIIKLKKAKKFFKLASFGETEIKPDVISAGEIKNEKELVQLIKSAMGSVKGEKLNTKHVIVSLPEEKSFLQVIQLPKMKEEELKKAIYFEAENYVPVPIDQVYLDFQVVTPLYNHIDHLDVLIIALPKKTIDPYLSCLKDAGLKPVAFEIESQAIARALVKNEISPFPLLLIDLGSTRTSFIIFSGYSLKFTSFIPVSSKNFTEAISNNLKISFEEAERLKKKYGLQDRAGPKAQSGAKEISKKEEIFESLVPSLTDLIEQIKKYSDYYQTHSPHEHLPPGSKGIKKILLSGGGADLKGLASFLSLELKIPVELANPWVNILPNDKKEMSRLPLENSLSFTTALGLALRGAKDK